MNAFHFTLISVCLVCPLGHVAAAQNAGVATDFAQVAMIGRIEQLSQKARYSEIYSSLAPEYTGEVTEAHFVDVLRQMSWKIENVHTGTLEEYASISYVPVRGEVIRRGQLPLKIDTVVFFKKTDSGWKLVNFPFVTPNLPSFASIPEWFIGRFSELP